MIDNLSILLSHGLLAIAFWFLLQRDDLDEETPPVPDKEPEGFGHGRLKPGQRAGSDAQFAAQKDTSDA